MKPILLTGLIFLLLAFSTSQIAADEGWVIERFQSDITLQKSGEAKIIETITVDFNNLSKHGIYRDIPYVYELSGDKTYTEISVKQIIQNNENAKYQISRDEDYLRIKIGDPNITISGKNTYQLEYIATGILRGYEEYDEFYWNVTGNNWPVPINLVDVTFTIPEDGIMRIACFEGYTSSTSQCRNTQTLNTARFSSTRILDSSEGMTVVVGYKKNLIPLLTVERPKTFLEKFLSWPSLMTLAISFIFAVGMVISLWFKYGRDYWLGENPFGKKLDTGSIKPIGGHETIVVEFTPPDKLSPAEMGVLMDERAHTHDVVATIIDLAARGYLTITEVPKKWLFGKTDYILTKQNIEKQIKKTLQLYEEKLLKKLFVSSATITVSELKTTFYQELKEIKEELYKVVVSKHLFPSNPDKVRTKYIIIAVVIIIAGIAAMAFSIENDLIFPADFSAGIISSGLILSVVSQFMPRRTAYGRNLYRRSKGYLHFIKSAEKYRQQYFEKENLFNQVLPYAIIFGLTEKFSKAMHDIGVKNTNTGWFVGTHPFHSQTFAASMNDFSKSMSTAIATTPKGSGFSAGGGSSGGGFGGGGGGSW